MKKDDHNNGGTDTGSDSPDQPVEPWLPDVGFELGSALTAEEEAGLLGALRSRIPPGADVRTGHFSGHEHIGIWLDPPSSPRAAQSRDLGLARLSLLKGNETFGALLGLGPIYDGVYDAWDATPKRLDSSGRASSTGDIRLRSIGIEVHDGQKAFVLELSGLYSPAFVDLAFTLVSKSTLRVSGGMLHSSTARHLNTNFDLVALLTGITLLLPPLGEDFLEKYHGAASDTLHNGQIPDIGDSIVQTLPSEILLPLGLEMDIAYTRLEISDGRDARKLGGVVAAGLMSVGPREPKVSINGPREISAFNDIDQVTRRYSVTLDDLREPVRVHWTGGATDPAALSTDISFPVPKPGGPGFTHRIEVNATDVDGLTARAHLDVSLHLRPDETSVKCIKKPWLC